jgi:hypothetical protein
MPARKIMVTTRADKNACNDSVYRPEIYDQANSEKEQCRLKHCRKDANDLGHAPMNETILVEVTESQRVLWQRMFRPPAVYMEPLFG